MNIQLNGEAYTVQIPATVQTLIDTLKLGQGRVAVELNQEIIPRSQYSEQTLAENDRIEIVQAIGGG